MQYFSCSRRFYPNQLQGGGSNSVRNSRKCNRYNSLTEIDTSRDSSFVSPASTYMHAATPARERRKFVSFTVELQREGGPLGNTKNHFSHTICAIGKAISYEFNCL